ncbi:MAG: hypothetical protein RLZZ458_2842 [Planctomycetota bacterium]
MGDGNFTFVGIASGEASEVFAGGEETSDGACGVIESSGRDGFVAAISGVSGELVSEDFGCFV